MSQPEPDQLSFGANLGDEELELKRVPTTQIRAPEASGPDSRLRKSLEKLPFFAPVTLRRLGENASNQDGSDRGVSGEVSYEVVAGERRVSLAKGLGIDEVPASILPPEAKRWSPIVALAENIARGPNPLREALEIYRLRQNGHSEEDLVAHGIPRQKQKKALRLALAPDRIIEGVREGDISVGAARKVGNMGAAMQRRCAEHYRETGKLRHKDISRIREEHKRAEAEGLGRELFEDAPGAGELETGDVKSGGGEPDKAQPGGRERNGIGASAAEPVATGAEETSDQNSYEAADLERIQRHVDEALSSGFSERAILRAVHDRFDAHR